jgi:hypothetical protein
VQRRKVNERCNDKSQDHDVATLPWNILARLVEIFAFNNEHVSRWDLCVDYRFPKKRGSGLSVANQVNNSHVNRNSMQIVMIRIDRILRRIVKLKTNYRLTQNDRMMDGRILHRSVLKCRLFTVRMRI